MPARSLIEEMREALRGFYVSTVRGEVSDANVRGYLRAASQIEEIWQQIDDRLTQLATEGVAPWDAYAELRYPLAFIRAARTYQVIVQQLLVADDTFDHITLGYLPPVTYDQANALCHQILPNLQQAIAALHEPKYEPEEPIPLELGPRIEVKGHTCPLPHLAGMLGAVREVREWTAGLIAEYANAVRAANMPIPDAITAHLSELDGQLAQADSQLRFAEDLVGQITEQQATPELHEQAEDSLWDSLRAYFLLNQTVAMPELLQMPPDAALAPAPHSHGGYHDRHIRPRDLWRLAAPSARGELLHTTSGEEQMAALCEKMRGLLPAAAQQYADEAKAALARGDMSLVAAMSICPYEPLYRARRPLDIAGAHVPAGYEFHWDYLHGHIETAPRFNRVERWQHGTGQ